MSKNDNESSDIHNKYLNNIIMTNLSKSGERNSDYLAMLGRKVKGVRTPKDAKLIALHNL